MMVKYCKTKKSKQVIITLLPILEFPNPTIIDGLLILKGSRKELFTVVIGCKDKTCKTVGASHLFKLDMNNKIWDEMDDLKNTLLSVELAIDSSPFFESPAITSSELGGYIHILGDKGKIIYCYHVKEKTLSLSSMPCLVGTSDVLAWAMLECPRLEGDHVHIKQEKDKIRWLFKGELACKRLNKKEVSFCTRTTYDKNAITNAVEIYDSLSGEKHFMALNNNGGMKEYDMEIFQLMNHFRYPWPVVLLNLDLGISSQIGRARLWSFEQSLCHGSARALGSFAPQFPSIETPLLSHIGCPIEPRSWDLQSNRLGFPS
ncbi:hypothetical protein Tco_1330190 [Tanacetum coccineum]